MPQGMRDKIVRAFHQRQPVLKPLVECSSNRSDGIGSNSGGDWGSGDGRGDGRDGQEIHTKHQTAVGNLLVGMGDLPEDIRALKRG
jgi:hypothetical protein